MGVSVSSGCKLDAKWGNLSLLCWCVCLIHKWSTCCLHLDFGGGLPKCWHDCKSKSRSGKQLTIIQFILLSLVDGEENKRGQTASVTLESLKGCLSSVLKLSDLVIITDLVLVPLSRTPCLLACSTVHLPLQLFSVRNIFQDQEINRIT